MVNSIEKIKQPAPNIPIKPQENNTETVKYKVREARNVGVIQLPKITSTPLRDWVDLKRQELPHTVYKVKEKKYDIKDLQTYTGIATVLCGIASLIKIFGKK